MERGIVFGLIGAAVIASLVGFLRMAHVVHLDIDDGTKFLFGLAALLGLVALFQGRITICPEERSNWMRSSVASMPP
jgi:hypothetical protein